MLVFEVVIKKEKRNVMGKEIAVSSDMITEHSSAYLTETSKSVNTHFNILLSFDIFFQRSLQELGGQSLL